MNDIELKDLVIHIDPAGAGRVKLVSFEGKITNSNSYELNRRFQQIFEDENYDLIIDLSKLDYVNSMGVAIIFTLFYRSRDRGGRACIGGVHPFLAKVFSLMELPEGLKVFPGKDEALKSFSA